MEKHLPIFLSGVLACVLLTQPAFAQTSDRGFGPGGQGAFDPGQMLEKLLEEKGTELPDNWDEMTREEQSAFMEENGIEMGPGGNGQRGGNDFLKQRLEEAGVELPDNWDEMTREEQRAFMEENGLMGSGTLVRERNLLRNARHASRYKAFDGELLPKVTFTDDGEIRNREAVEFLQQRGILSGNADGSFKPKNPINRAEALKVIMEALGEEPDTSVSPTFYDVSYDEWFAGYVNRAWALKIIQGYSDNTFRPSQTVNQAELLKIAFESFGIDLSDYAVTNLPSGIDATAWYAPYLQYALDNDLLDLNAVDLDAGMTRELFSELIYRLIEQQESME